MTATGRADGRHALEGPTGECSAEADHGRRRGRLYRRLHSNPVTGLATKVVVTVVGLLVILTGVVMLFTPGQGVLALILGLWILRIEYEWADRWLRKVRERAHEARLRAQEMDPQVRRRRILWGVVLTILVTAAVLTYLLLFDWPSLAIDGWDWVQGFGAWIPELPGM